MYYEFAIDPGALSSWDRTRFFLDALGPWKGRFLAEYPRKWKRMVFESLSCPDVEKKRIIERLSQLDKRVFSSRANGPYEGSRPWLDNAEAEHLRQQFHAIVATFVGSSNEAYKLDASQVDETNERWRIDTGRLLSREPAVYIDALRLLLASSKRIVLVDPYFRADQADKTAQLIAFCKAMVTNATLEVHFADEPRGYEPCMRDAGRALPNLLPNGVSVALHCWKERPGGPRLHNRYVLTEIGGVKFGDGIEKGSAGHEDHLSILDEPSRLKLWEQYVGAHPAFDPAGASQTFLGRNTVRNR